MESTQTQPIVTQYLVFDTESTGTDPHTARIVQAFIGIFDATNDTWIASKEWIINPTPTPVPTEASDIHGFTTERLKTEGRKDVRDALWEISSAIQQYCGTYTSTTWRATVPGIPLVAYNAPYDTTLLNAELRRHDLPTLDYNSAPHAILATANSIQHVIDPLVIDKAIDKYRKGSRKLTAVAAHYRVPNPASDPTIEAHNAAADCLMTARIAAKLLALPALQNTSPASLQLLQKEWKAEQAASLQDYFRTKANPPQPDAVIDPSWPVSPLKAQAQNQERNPAA